MLYLKDFFVVNSKFKCRRKIGYLSLSKRLSSRQNDLPKVHKNCLENCMEIRLK